MKSSQLITHKLVPLIAGFVLANFAYGFDSGSTGADGIFSPSADVEVALPPDGIFNYVSVNIPLGVTVTFQKNAANTPVIWLVQQDVVINGTVDVSGESNGQGGPGGFNGGMQGLPGGGSGWGLGPGGGGRDKDNRCYGASGSYGSVGARVTGSGCGPFTGALYGREEIIPLTGGSGGGGGSQNDATSTAGSAGGGGGGAILIAASGTIDVVGSIVSNGGASLDVDNGGGCGGHGSGGAIKLVATVIQGEGTVQAAGVSPLCNSDFGPAPASGNGRIRFEAETLARSSGTTPNFSFDLPQPLFVPNFPTLSISSVAGITVPANPTGMNDVQVPASTANPVDVVFSTVNVPLGSTVNLRLLPLVGSLVTATSSPVTGTEASGAATASISLVEGSSTLLASVTFTVDSTAGLQYSPYADGQVVAQIRTSYEPGKGSITTFITEDGKEYDWPISAVGIN